MKPSSTQAESSSATGWYYARNGRKGGPVSFQQLQQFAAAGKLLPTDRLLRPGGTAWELAGNLPGLFGASKEVPVSQAQPSPRAGRTPHAPVKASGIEKHLPAILVGAGAAVFLLVAVGL